MQIPIFCPHCMEIKAFKDCCIWIHFSHHQSQWWWSKIISQSSSAQVESVLALFSISHSSRTRSLPRAIDQFNTELFSSFPGNLRSHVTSFAFVSHVLHFSPSLLLVLPTLASRSQEAWNLDFSSEAGSIIPSSHGSLTVWLYLALVSTAPAERERHGETESHTSGYKVTDTLKKEKKKTQPVVMLSTWHSTSILQLLQEDDQFPAVATLANQCST